MQQLKAIKVVLFLLAGIAAYGNPDICNDTVQAKTFNIMDYGAISSHEKLSTKAIQAAIDACSENGSGTVIIPKGVYVTGTLFLKSNVTIKMEGNGVRSAFQVNNVSEVTFDKINIQGNPKHLMQITGDTSKSVTIKNTDVKEFEQPFSYEKGAKKEMGIVE